MIRTTVTALATGLYYITLCAVAVALTFALGAAVISPVPGAPHDADALRIETRADTHTNPGFPRVGGITTPAGITVSG